MNKLREIFSQKPEKMSSFVKWFFGLPLAYICYFILSFFLPNLQSTLELSMITQMLRSLVLILCVFLLTKYFLGFELNKFFCESGVWNFKVCFMGFFLMSTALVITNLCLFLVFPSAFSFIGFVKGFALNWICSLLLILVSAFCEELIFRCYFAWFAKPYSPNALLSLDNKKILLHCFVSAFVFMFAHFSNPEVESNAVLSMLFYFILGFCLMLFFFKSGGMEFGLGVHFANNLFSAWILNYNGSVLKTDSLFLSKLPISFISVLQVVLCMIFCIVLCPIKKVPYEEKTQA